MEFLFWTKLQASKKYAPIQVFSKVSLQFVAIYNEFLDILGTFISRNTFQQMLLTVVRFTKYSFPKLQYIRTTGNHGLKKPKMLNVSNENLTVLKWQNIHSISKIKYITMYSTTCSSSLLYIQQMRIQNPIKHLRQSDTFFANSFIIDV